MSGKRWADAVSEGLDMPLKRAEVLQALRNILDKAFERMGNRYTKTGEKIKWARIAVQASAAATPLMRDVELTELLERLEKLEEVIRKE